MVLTLLVLELLDQTQQVKVVAEHVGLQHGVEAVNGHLGVPQVDCLTHDHALNVGVRTDIQGAHGVQHQVECVQLVEFGVQFDQRHEDLAAQFDVGVLNFLEYFHHQLQICFFRTSVEERS